MLRILLTLLGSLLSLAIIIIIFMMIFRVCPSKSWGPELPWCIKQEPIVSVEKIKDSLDGKIDFDKVEETKEIIEEGNVGGRLFENIKKWFLEKII